MSTTKILIAEDHHLITYGLKNIIHHIDKECSIDIVSNLTDIMKKLKRNKYNYFISDYDFVDGTITEIIPNIKTINPQLKVMIYCGLAPIIYSDICLENGADYFVPKTATLEELKATIKFMFLELKTDNLKEEESTRINPFSKLSCREIEVLHYIAKGSGTVEIAKTLNVVPTTVSNLKNRIKEKTKSNSIAELLKKAKAHRITE